MPFDPVTIRDGRTVIQEVGFDAPGTERNGHGLRDGTGAPKHLRMGGFRFSQVDVPELVQLGANHEKAAWLVAQRDGPSSPDGGGSYGWDFGPLYSRADDRLYGGSQQPVSSHEAQGL